MNNFQRGYRACQRNKRLDEIPRTWWAGWKYCAEIGHDKVSMNATYPPPCRQIGEMARLNDWPGKARRHAGRRGHDTCSN